MCVHLYVCTFVCVYICMCVHLFVCMCVHLYVCTFVCVYICLCVCVHLFVCMCTFVCVHLLVCACVHLSVCACVCLSVYLCVHVYVYLSVFILHEIAHNIKPLLWNERKTHFFRKSVFLWIPVVVFYISCNTCNYTCMRAHRLKCMHTHDHMLTSMLLKVVIFQTNYGKVIVQPSHILILLLWKKWMY